MNRIFRALAALSILILAWSVPLAAAPGEESIALTDAPGKDLTIASCAICHSLDYLSMNAAVMNRTGWDKTLHKMVDRFGAPISAENLQVILDYLALHYSEAP